MTGREFLNSLDDEYFAIALVAIYDGMDIVIPKLLARNDEMREDAKAKEGLIAIRAAFIAKFLESDASNGINIAEG